MRPPAASYWTTVTGHRRFFLRILPESAGFGNGRAKQATGPGNQTCGTAHRNRCRAYARRDSANKSGRSAAKHADLSARPFRSSFSKPQDRGSSCTRFRVLSRRARHGNSRKSPLPLHAHQTSRPRSPSKEQHQDKHPQPKLEGWCGSSSISSFFLSCISYPYPVPLRVIWHSERPARLQQGPSRPHRHRLLPSDNLWQNAHQRPRLPPRKTP